MRFWIDTEYHDTGTHVELISLGAVSQDGREFYAISTEFDADGLLPWTRENVLTHLSPRDSGDWRSLQDIGSDCLAFVGDSPAEFWSYISTDDSYLVTRLLPYGLNGLPENLPFECWSSAVGNAHSPIYWHCPTPGSGCVWHHNYVASQFDRV